jgi:hypothetical protein
VAQIYNSDGRILSEPLANISVSDPISVYDMRTNKPLEKAQIKLARLDPQTGSLKPVSMQEYSIRISGYTDNNGQISFFLPAGDYQIEIDSLGYKRELKTFEIGIANNKQYPKFYLTPEPLSFLSFFYYYGNISVDLINTSIADIQIMAISNRYFELNSFLVMCLLIIFAFLAFRARIQIPILSMYDYFFHLGKLHLSGTTGSDRIVGKITDEQTGNPLTDCEVFLLNTDKQTIVGHIHTGNDGNFSFLKLSNIKYALQIIKPGYKMVMNMDAGSEQNNSH